MPVQRACDAESQAGNGAPNGPPRMQSNVGDRKVFCNVGAYVSCRGCVGIPLSAWAARPMNQGGTAKNFRPWQKEESFHSHQRERPCHGADTGRGIFRALRVPGQEVEYGDTIGEILDPFTAEVVAPVTATTSGLVFFAIDKSLVLEHEVVFKLIRRLHA